MNNLTFKQRREKFETDKNIYASKKLTFIGVEGYDVYNCSIPFEYNNERYIFGRVERRTEWARSWSYLFKHEGNDIYRKVENSMIYHIEDPYIAVIKNEFVLGGTSVLRMNNEIESYRAYFYRGTDLMNLYYFTTGPIHMKDIRLVQIAGKIGVFSRPNGVVGFTLINSLDELNADVIMNAKLIDNMFDGGEWGSCNQAYLLDSGYIGIIGHKCYKYKVEEDKDMNAYLNVSFVYDYKNNEILDEKIIGTRTCYPDGETKKFITRDSAFTSGIVMREDNKCDLYSGINDIEEGIATIDYPFAGFGNVITKTQL